MISYFVTSCHKKIATMAPRVKKGRKEVNGLTPKDWSRRKRGSSQPELDFKIIKIWQEDKSTQTEESDFEWTQEQQDSLKELKIQLYRVTRDLFTADSPDSP